MAGREISLGRMVVLVALAGVLGCGRGAASDADSDTAAAAQEATPQAQQSGAAAGFCRGVRPHDSHGG